MSDPNWTITTSEKKVAVDAIEAPAATLTRGEHATIRVAFDRRSAEDEGFQQRYRTVLDLIEYNGERASTADTSYQGVPWYREHPPDGAPIDSFVISIDPEDESGETRGFWAIVLGGGDESTAGADVRIVSLELFVLGLTEEYGDRGELEDEFAWKTF